MVLWRKLLTLHNSDYGTMLYDFLDQSLHVPCEDLKNLIMRISTLSRCWSGELSGCSKATCAATTMLSISLFIEKVTSLCEHTRFSQAFCMNISENEDFVDVLFVKEIPSVLVVWIQSDVLPYMISVNDVGELHII